MRSPITGTRSKIAYKYHANIHKIGSGGGGGGGGCAKCREKGAPLPPRVSKIFSSLGIQ
jgi:hypothetical protein